MLPVRPKPQITSSAISSTSYFCRTALDLLEISLGRHDDAAGAHHRLGDEGGDGLGALAQDLRLEALGQPRGEVLLALARLARSGNDAGSRRAGCSRSAGRNRDGCWAGP